VEEHAVTAPSGPDPAAQEALRAAAASLDRLGRAVTAIGGDGRVVVWNARATAVTGWPSEAVRGKPLADLVHGRSRDDLAEGLAVLGGARNWTAGLDLEGPRAKALRVEMSAEPVLVDDRVVGFAAVLRPLAAGHVERIVRELSAVLLHVADAVIVTDQHGRVTGWNPAAEQMLGWSRAEMLGAQLDRLIPASDRGMFQRVWEQLAAGQLVAPYETSRLDRDGVEHLVSAHAAGFREHGLFAGAVATYRPLSSRQLEDRLLSAGLAQMPVLVLAYDGQAVVTLTAGGGDITGGLVPELVRGTALREALPQESALLEAIDASLSGRATQLPVLIGELVWQCHIAPAGTGGLLFAVDVTHQRLVDDRLSALLDATPVCLVNFDADGRVTYAAGSGFDGFGVDPADTVGQTMLTLYGDNLQIGQAVTDCLAGRDVDLVLEYGRRQWDVHYRAHRVPGGEVTGGVCIAQAVTDWSPPDQAAAAATGTLPGHLELHRRLGEPLRPGCERAVAVVAMDGLEVLEAEDLRDGGGWVRRVLADRLQQAAGAADVYQRPPGLVALVLDAADVRDEIASIVRDVQRAVARPVDRPSGEDVHLAARVGVAVSDSAPLGGLLRSAEQACRQAQLDEHLDLRWFTPDLQPKRMRLGLVGDLRQALPRDELRLHYQPIVDLSSHQAVGAEALVRWEHPTQGLLPPLAFIGLAENTGLIHEIGTWVARAACGMAASLAAGGTPLQVAVNVSAHQLSDDGFVDLVTGLLAETGCPARLLSIEVTETAVAEDIDAAIATLTALKALGVQLALDDFGTGYSSLLYLKHFPVDTIKIDRSFVSGLGANEQDGVIVASTVSLAHRIGVTCVAEGVETVDQLELLRKMGCDYAQGYLFSRPLPAEALPHWLRIQTPVSSGRATVPMVPVADLAQILRLHEEGASPHTIAAAMNVTGKRSPRGTRWHATSVAAVIARAAYPNLDLRQRPSR
jgi:PAS domain S-box-containing protein